MKILDKEDVYSLINRGEGNIELVFKPDIVGKYQLFLMGCTFKKIELFKTGPVDARNLGLLINYTELINIAVEKGYRVFVYKDNGIFKRGDWYLEFLSK